MGRATIPGIHDVNGEERVSCRWVASELGGGFASADIRCEDAERTQGWLTFYSHDTNDPGKALGDLRRLFARMVEAIDAEIEKHAACKCEEAPHGAAEQ